MAALVVYTLVEQQARAAAADVWHVRDSSDSTSRRRRRSHPVPPPPPPAPPAHGFPRWTAPQPDPHQPLGGYPKLRHLSRAEVLHGGKHPLPGSDAGRIGSYNHNVMIDFLVGDGGGFVTVWKNGMTDEDSNGQRLLYSRSPDATNWTVPNIFIPNITTPGHPLTMEPGPCIHARGRLYCGGSPGFHNTSHDSSAQGSQFCLWPDPLNPRNCGPPSNVEVHYNSSLLLREIRRDGKLGPMFWAAPAAPTQFESATAAFNIPALPQMDPQTRADLASVDASFAAGETPCDELRDGTLKCEACRGGCQIWDTISFDIGMSNERTHYVLPQSKGMQEMILYRSGKTHTLWASKRNGTSQEGWSPVVETDIPNDKSNLNAGPLPDGRVYLVHNPVTPTPAPSPRARSDSTAIGPQLRDDDAKAPSFRDPVTISFSNDGLEWHGTAVALTCTDLSTSSTCQLRYPGHAKNGGPSYPREFPCLPAWRGSKRLVGFT